MSGGLLDLSNEPATLTIGETTYTIGRLTLADEQKIQKKMRDTRLQAVVDLFNVTPLSDEALSLSIAGVANHNIGKTDILADTIGEQGMIAAAVTVDGKPVTSLPSIDRRVLTHMLLWMSNYPPKKDAECGPFPDGSRVLLNTPTGTKVNSGTEKCPPSAPNST
jgi:hypothetical protein